MKFTRIPENTFKEIQLNAGVLLKTFDTTSNTIEEENIIGATTGGISFTATPTHSDFGEDIDNCPPGTKELMQLDSWEVTMSGTFVTTNASAVKLQIGSADVSGDKITPRNNLLQSDFADLWWVGDYSDKNGAKNGGHIAIHMLNSLSTGGFQLQSNNRAKGQFAFEFRGHYSIAAQDVVPFEVYVHQGTEEGAGA